MEGKRCNCHYCYIRVNNNIPIKENDPIGARMEWYCRRYDQYLSFKVPEECPKKRDPFEYLANTFCKGHDGNFYFMPVIRLMKDCLLYLEQEYRFFFYEYENYRNCMSFIETKRFIIEDLLYMGYIEKIPVPYEFVNSLHDLEKVCSWEQK